MQALVPACQFAISLFAGAGAHVSFADLLCVHVACLLVSFKDFFVRRR